MSRNGITLYDLTSTKEYKEKSKWLVEAIKARHEDILKIKKFAIEQRGWPEEEAEMLGVRMTGSSRVAFDKKVADTMARLC